MKSPIIELKEVWKTYSMGTTDVSALRGVNLTINDGDFVAITGPSGSGKSTMANLLGCLDVPSRGEIYLVGKDIATLSESNRATLRGRTIGFIFQQFNLFPTLTALQNVMLPLEIQDEPTHLAKDRAQTLLTQLGLQERTHHLPSQLSGGQQQRVAIARALSCDPDIILADEPTGNLDTKTGIEVLSMLKSLWKTGKTIVMITHESEFAKVAHKQVKLRDGLIIS